MSASVETAMSENSARPTLTTVPHLPAETALPAAILLAILSACAAKDGSAKCAKMTSKSVMNQLVRIMLNVSICSKISFVLVPQELMESVVKHHPNAALAILAAMADTAKIWVMDSTVLAQEITLVSAANMSMTPAQLMPARMVPPVLTREWDTNVSAHLAMKARTVTSTLMTVLWDYAHQVPPVLILPMITTADVLSI